MILTRDTLSGCMVSTDVSAQPVSAAATSSVKSSSTPLFDWLCQMSICKVISRAYATLGPSYWSDTSVQCIEAREVTLQIDVSDQYDGPSVA